jgi:hypothetical protein
MPAGSKPGERRGGRQKGTPNKVTADARKAIGRFVDRNTSRLQGWLNKIANGIRDPKDRKRYLVAPNPQRAFELATSVMEFHIPKLSRKEISGPLGGAIPVAAANQQITDDDAMKSYLKLVKGDAQ